MNVLLVAMVMIVLIHMDAMPAMNVGVLVMMVIVQVMMEVLIMEKRPIM